MNITKERTEEIRTALQMDAAAWTAGDVFTKIFAVMTDMPELKEARQVLDYAIGTRQDHPCSIWVSGGLKTVISAGASEGIYIDLALEDEAGRELDFGTMKTLREDLTGYACMGTLAGAFTGLYELWRIANWKQICASDDAARKAAGPRELTIAVKRPGGDWEPRTVRDELPVYQQIVDGYIEHICSTPGGILIFGNEEGKLRGLPLNIFVNGDPIVGTLFAVRSDDEGAFESVNDEDLKVLKLGDSFYL